MREAGDPTVISVSDKDSAYLTPPSRCLALGTPQSASSLPALALPPSLLPSHSLPPFCFPPAHSLLFCSLHSHYLPFSSPPLYCHHHTPSVLSSLRFPPISRFQSHSLSPPLSSNHISTLSPQDTARAPSNNTWHQRHEDNGTIIVTVMVTVIVKLTGRIIMILMMMAFTGYTKNNVTTKIVSSSSLLSLPSSSPSCNIVLHCFTIQI